MTITIAPETEAKLREKAEREGKDINAIVDSLLASALKWEAHITQAEVEAIRQGLEACDAGRVRPWADFAAEMRAKYNLPTHLSDEELHTP